ncbi:MAG TPA: class I SAM-dependent methyltransferase [Xanthobacteraceae bacterium]|nr:class I SAM-dependent methyltransferase [Xanthobacteraceae bacterium]
MATADADPFAKFKAAQREAWSVFAPVEVTTTIPAAKLVKFAQIGPGQKVLDVACGTGVVAVTAALIGAKVAGLDLTPVLIERAQQNAATAGVDIDFIEGDAEVLPYPDAAFDVVVSQFGHIFAPRPAVVTKEMLRVLRPGGRIAFSTWPPDSLPGRLFAFVARHVPPPPGAEPPAQWGDPNVIRERLGAAVTDLVFDRATLVIPTLSPAHFRAAQEKTIGPLTKLVEAAKDDPAKLAKLRGEFDAMARTVLDGNAAHLHFIMTRAVKA